MNTHHAVIDAQGPTLIDPLAKIAEQSGFAVSCAGSAVQIDASLLLGFAVLNVLSDNVELVSAKTLEPSFTPRPVATAQLNRRIGSF